DGPGPLLRRAGVAIEPEARIRYASVLLCLGEPGPAREALALRPDPATRVAFIHGFGAWHGDLAGLPDMLLNIDDPAFRSGMAMATGLLDPEGLAPGERGRLGS